MTDQPQAPPVERLVNLTDQLIELPREPGAGSAAAGRLRLPPGGVVARVDDERATIRYEKIDSPPGSVSLTILRRSRRVAGLPRPQPGTRYVVSRPAALAARGRRDLLFPFGEIRDDEGQVIGTGGLAAFRPARLARLGLRRWPAAARDWLAKRREPAQWLTGVLFATATALLSGAIALLPGALDFAKANSWQAAWGTWTLRLAVAFGGGGIILLGWAAWRWHLRGLILADRGTAYVIEEEAITWRHEEKESVLAAITGRFASVLQVPGPGQLDSDWTWQAGGESASAWDARADELVRSFWSVHYNDDKVTRNAVFIWAPWPVATAFGARATARRPGLVLNVRQRPSAGGALRRIRLNDQAHDFLRDELAAPGPQPLGPAFTVAELTARLKITIAPVVVPGTADLRGRNNPSGVLLLVVRITRGPVGPVRLDLDQTPPFTLRVARSLARRLIPVGTFDVPAAEWRLNAVAGQPPASTPAGTPRLPWRAFPAVAESIADWVVRQAAERPGDIVLLAARVPQEVAVGLGVQLGQRAMELEPGQRWPRRVYPVFYTRSGLVVPNLRLGADSVPSQRV